MKIKVKSTLLMIILTISLLCSKEVAKATENTIYYVETDEDELIVLERAFANNEQFVTIRYLASKESELTFYTLGTDYYKLHIELNKYAKIGHNDRTGYSIPSYHNYTTARGQLWKQIDYVIIYKNNVTNEDYDNIRQEIRNIIINSEIYKKNDYEKTKWAYEWVTNNIDYMSYQSSTYNTFKTGLGNCVGHSLLLELFLVELGLNTLPVIGLGDTEGHQWNMIEFDNRWYQIDSTWDTTYGTKHYFLKGEETFSYHNTSFPSRPLPIDDKVISKYDLIYSYQNSNIPARLLGATFDLVDYERLNVGEKYQWLISNEVDIKFEFTSSDTNVASVDDKGNITALMQGETVITAINKNLNVMETIHITVSKELSQVIDYDYVIKAKEVNLKCLETAQIELEILGEHKTLHNIKYVSGNPYVATVDNNGIVTACKNGTAYITISCDGADDIIVRVTVKPIVNIQNRELVTSVEVEVTK